MKKAESIVKRRKLVKLTREKISKVPFSVNIINSVKTKDFNSFLDDEPLLIEHFVL